MNALERIKSMKPPTELMFMNTYQDFKFLLRAIEVYRDIAIDNCFLGVAEPYRLPPEKLEKLRKVTFFNQTNEEFEKRMQGGEK